MSRFGSGRRRYRRLVSRRYLRPGILAGHLLVLIAALVCLRLGWWQWNVAHLTRGTIQNLGYALLWPVFGGAFIFMWLRFLYLEDERRAQQPEIAEAAGILEATPSDATPAGPGDPNNPGDPSSPGDPAVADGFDLIGVGAEPLDAGPMDESSTAPSDLIPTGPVDGPSGGDARGDRPGCRGRRTTRAGSDLPESAGLTAEEGPPAARAIHRRDHRRGHRRRRG